MNTKHFISAAALAAMSITPVTNAFALHVHAQEPEATPGFIKVQGAVQMFKADQGQGDQFIRADQGQGDQFIRADQGQGDQFIKADQGQGDQFIKADQGQDKNVSWYGPFDRRIQGNQFIKADEAAPLALHIHAQEPEATPGFIKVQGAVQMLKADQGQGDQFIKADQGQDKSVSWYGPFDRRIQGDQFIKVDQAEPLALHIHAQEPEATPGFIKVQGDQFIKADQGQGEQFIRVDQGQDKNISWYGPFDRRIQGDQFMKVDQAEPLALHIHAQEPEATPGFIKVQGAVDMLKADQGQGDQFIKADQGQGEQMANWINDLKNYGQQLWEIIA